MLEKLRSGEIEWCERSVQFDLFRRNPGMVMAGRDIFTRADDYEPLEAKPA
jgi:hypothetical protein